MVGNVSWGWEATYLAATLNWVGGQQFDRYGCYLFRSRIFSEKGSFWC